MVNPFNNMPTGPLDVNRSDRLLDQKVNDNSSRNDDTAWFLPLESSSLQTISAVEDPSFQNLGAEALADHILSHIGA